MNYLIDCGRCNKTGCQDGDTITGSICLHCRGKGRVVITKVPNRWSATIRVMQDEVENYRQRGYVVHSWQ